MEIIIVSPKRNRRFNLHLKIFVIVIVLTSLVAFLILFIYNLAIFTTHKVNQQKITQLHKENKIVRQEIGRIKKEFTELSIFIDSLQLYDKKLRAYASLEPINDDLRYMGVGGAVLNKYNTPELSDEVRNNLEQLSTALDNLLARSRLQKKNFNELLTYLKEKKYLREHTPSLIPVQGWYISGFGYRLDPFTGKVKMHEGLDIAAPIGTPIIAPADGTVKFVGHKHGFGLTVEINHGYGFTTLYAHCQRIKVEEGDVVKRGDVIAYVGTTGKSTGPHLHYEVRIAQTPVNPINYILTTSSITD